MWRNVPKGRAGRRWRGPHWRMSLPAMGLSAEWPGAGVRGCRQLPPERAHSETLTGGWGSVVGAIRHKTGTSGVEGVCMYKAWPEHELQWTRPKGGCARGALGGHTCSQAKPGLKACFYKHLRSSMAALCLLGARPKQAHPGHTLAGGRPQAARTPGEAAATTWMAGRAPGR